MEPLTALGAAAASVQLVELAARSIMGATTLVRKLREIPERTAKLLVDVDRSAQRIVNMSTLLLQPNPRTRSGLSTEQCARLSNCAAEARRAMDDLQRLLASLCDNSAPGSNRGKAVVQRTWKAVTAVYKQDQVAEMLSRVDRLNLEVVRELELVSLEMQVVSCETSSATLAAVQNNQTVNTTRFDSLDLANQHMSGAVRYSQTVNTARFDSLDLSSQEVSAAIQDSQTDNSTRFDRLDIASQGLQTTIRDYNHSSENGFRDMRQSFQRIEARLKYITTNILIAQQNPGRSVSESQPDNQSNHPTIHMLAREDWIKVATLSDNLTTSLLSGVATTGLQPGNSALTSEEKAEMEKDFCRQLIRYPSSLRNAHQNARLAVQKYRDCSCRPTVSSRHHQSWQLVFAYNSESEHRPDCHFYAAGFKSWNYSVAAQLFPLLNQTVELVLGATSGAGRWTVASPLRLRGTVRRSESPIFRLFDDLPWRYIRVGEPCLDLYQAMTWKWDISALSLGLEQACQEIRMAAELGLASGADTDEAGFSFLFVSSEPAPRRKVPVLMSSRKYSGSRICCQLTGGRSPPI